MRRGVTTALALAAVLAGCDPGADAPPRRHDAGPTDGSPPPPIDAGPRPDAGPVVTWFDRIYGPNDGRMPGDSCDVAFDECRNTMTLMVCLDDARDPSSGMGTCRDCESDDECRTEYAYIADLVTCVSGRCEIEGGSTCTPMVGWCHTARAGSFVCIDGLCERCISEAECDAEYGADWTCDLMSGQCRDTTRPPPDAGP